MWFLFALTLFLSSASYAASSGDKLVKRQLDSTKISAAEFRRKGYASVAVLGTVAYIDGGEFSYSQDDTIVYQYASTLTSIDLSTSWTNSTVTLNSIAKPPGVPDLVSGGIWVDHVNNILYTGFAGRPSVFGNDANQSSGLWTFSPNGVTGGTWNNLNKTVDPNFMTDQRMYSSLVASGGGIGYSLGGFISEIITGNDPSPGLLTYNFTSKNLTNSTVSGSDVIRDGYDEMGGMEYVPHFGESGILIALGGSRFFNGSDHLNDMSFVTIYDINSSTWNDVHTTGEIPEDRKEFCIASLPNLSNQTVEILVYAGWNGNLGSTSVPYDEAFVLSLPAFNWFKAEYPAENPRHAVSCAHVGGPQILTVGGVDTTQNTADTITGLYEGVFDTPDPFTNGLAIFNMNEMAFTNGYNANPANYTGAQPVLEYYASNPRVSSSLPTAVAAIMSHSSFPSSPTNSSSSSQTSHHVSAGVIAGGVIGGIAGLAIITFVVVYLLRTRQQQKKLPAELDPKDSRAELMVGPNHPNETASTYYYYYQNGDGYGHVVSQEKQELSAGAIQENKLGGGLRQELPTSGNEVHELA